MRYFVETVGWVAAGMMLAAYVLLTLGRLSSKSGIYHWLNILSGVGFILNSGWNGAYPSAFINVVWAVIGLYGVFGPGRPTAPAEGGRANQHCGARRAVGRGAAVLA